MIYFKGTTYFKKAFDCENLDFKNSGEIRD